MNPQVSIEELKVCALLYSIPNSIIMTLQDVLEAVNNDFIDLGPPEKIWNRILGTWYHHPFCTSPKQTIDSLLIKKLIRCQEEHSKKFYVLDIQDNHKKFLTELKMQIALGSVL